MKIAWIGCGVMETSILLNLKKSGHTVSAYNRTYEKAVPLLEQRIRVEYTIRDCVNDADIICTMVDYPKGVEEVYKGDDGISTHAKAYAILIDFITSSPALARKLYTAAKTREYAVLDTPVFGGDGGTKVAPLSIMTGRDEEVFEQMRPLFSLLGTGVQYIGETRSGQHTKTCNQIAVAGTVTAMSETLVHARAAGLDEQKMPTAVTKGAAGSWQIDNTAPRILANDFAPGFYIKHFIKDARIVQQEMEQQDVHLNMLEVICNMYGALAGMGEESNDTRALVHYYKWIQKL